MLDVTAQNYNKEIENSKIPVVIDFWAEWCKACKMFMPIVQEIEKTYVGKVKFVKINVEDFPEIASKFCVTSLPTILLMNNGFPVDSSIGSITKNKLIAFIDKNL